MFILLSTFKGATYLQAQLQSLLTQSHVSWTLYWRDDGSNDDTIAILAGFAAQIGSDRCIRVRGPAGPLGPTASFIAVLRAALRAMRTDDAIAFADQDDIWLPDKLSRGIEMLAAVSRQTPALYCARLAVVDADLRPIMETHMSPEACGFPHALTQNIATGCTVMLNQTAAALVAGSRFPPATMHDWWSYLLVSAAGGQVVMDQSVVVLYRQHGGNFIGMQRSQLRRAITALQRGPSKFMNVLRQHVTALLAQADLISQQNHAMLVEVDRALNGGLRERLKVLALPGLHRQNRLETLLFRAWFLIG